MKAEDYLKKDFECRGYAALNLLAKQQICKIWSANLNDFKEDQWLYIIKNRILEQDFKADQIDLIKEHYKIAREDFDKGKFTFAFSRITATDYDALIPIIREIYDFFSTKIKSLAEEVSGRALSKMPVFYLTRFDKGDFLTTHCDSGNSVGVVLNLSIDWKPEHGGLTVMLPKENELEGKTYLPTLGGLLIFDVSERKLLHFVSEVTSDSPNKRISVVARYD